MLEAHGRDRLARVAYPHFPQKKPEWSGVLFPTQVILRPSLPNFLSLNLLKCNVFII